jgi:hypothetical protein
VYANFGEFLFHALGWSKGMKKGQSCFESRPSATFANHYFFCTLLCLPHPVVKNHLYCCGRGLPPVSIAPVVTTAL